MPGLQQTTPAVEAGRPPVVRRSEHEIALPVETSKSDPVPGRPHERRSIEALKSEIIEVGHGIRLGP